MIKKLSEKEKLAIVAEMMTNHGQLCSDIFDISCHLQGEVKDKLLRIQDFILDYFLDFFPLLQIDDLHLCGSLCSYIYTPYSDLNLFIILAPIFPNEQINIKIFKAINSYLSGLNVQPTIYNHHINYLILQKADHKINNFNAYSVLQGEWKQKPVRNKFAFTPQELYAAYGIYSAKLHHLVAELPKTGEGFLTQNSRIVLYNYLENLKENAFDCKSNSIEHEYGLEYNLYRLLKRFGTWEHFQSYISDSYKNTLGKKYEN